MKATSVKSTSRSRCSAKKITSASSPAAFPLELRLRATALEQIHVGGRAIGGVGPHIAGGIVAVQHRAEFGLSPRAREEICFSVAPAGSGIGKSAQRASRYTGSSPTRNREADNYEPDFHSAAQDRSPNTPEVFLDHGVRRMLAVVLAFGSSVRILNTPSAVSIL